MSASDEISKGLAYLTSRQLPSGGFVSLSSPDPQAFTGATVYHTTFFPSLVLLALQDIHMPAAATIRQRATDFLLEQKSEQWSFNYWDRHSPEARALPYPDDLDDTFCALAGLYRQQPALFTGGVMASIAQLLIAAEVQPGGPYRTWLVDKTAAPAWRDVDVGVNANIGYFLSLQAVQLPQLVSLIEKALPASLSSPYYPDDYPLLYFLSRWYRGPHYQLVVERLLARRQDGHWSDPLHTALAMTTLLNYGVPPRRLKTAAAYLKTYQTSRGSWAARAFCIDPARRGQTHYAGAEALTTAFCLEALHHYARASQPALGAAPKTKPAIYTSVVREVQRTIRSLPHADLRHYTRQVLARIMDQDDDGQIILLPWLVAKTASLTLEPQTLHQLALGSLWGWMAYTIYDDFLDTEGDPHLLPSANLCLRRLCATHACTLPDNADFQAEVRLIMDRLDAANAWELSHCRGNIAGGIFRIKRLPDYGELAQLADRSLGHTIAGLGVLYAAGFEADSQPMIALRRFFHHYLVARQLNDDAHDWEEDLRLGHVNVVGAMILQHWLKTNSHTLKQGIDLTADLERLRQIMWERVITKAAKAIHRHAHLARTAVRVPGSKLDSGPFDQLLVPLEAAADLALRKRDEVLEFITAL